MQHAGSRVALKNYCMKKEANDANHSCLTDVLVTPVELLRPLICTYNDYGREKKKVEKNSAHHKSNAFFFSPTLHNREPAIIERDCMNENSR